MFILPPSPLTPSKTTNFHSPKASFPEKGKLILFIGAIDPEIAGAEELQAKSSAASSKVVSLISSTPSQGFSNKTTVVLSRLSGASNEINRFCTYLCSISVVTKILSTIILSVTLKGTSAVTPPLINILAFEKSVAS